LLKLLSCQIRLAKNGIGRSLARATEATALHTLLRVSGRGSGTASTGFGGGAKARASSSEALSSATWAIASSGSGFTGWLAGEANRGASGAGESGDAKSGAGVTRQNTRVQTKSDRLIVPGAARAPASRRLPPV